MFSSILHKRLPAEAGVSVVCVSPGIVHTNVVSFMKHIKIYKSVYVCVFSMCRYIYLCMHVDIAYPRCMHTLSRTIMLLVWNFFNLNWVGCGNS